MSENENPSSKNIIFKGSDLSLDNGMIKYGKKDHSTVSDSLRSSVGGKKFSSLKEALSSVEKDLKRK